MTRLPKIITAMTLFIPSIAVGDTDGAVKLTKYSVCASPYSDSAVEVEFDISGLSGVIEALRTACNW